MQAYDTGLRYSATMQAYKPRWPVTNLIQPQGLARVMTFELAATHLLPYDPDGEISDTTGSGISSFGCKEGNDKSAMMPQRQVGNDAAMTSRQ
jgi:hypothetical protein